MFHGPMGLETVALISILGSSHILQVLSFCQTVKGLKTAILKCNTRYPTRQVILGRNFLGQSKDDEYEF